MKENRKVVSQILKMKRKWFDIKNGAPGNSDPVVIRLCHKTLFTGETTTEVYPLEDVKIATCTDGHWAILPPFPKYDYSPLSKKETINENVDVTHWSVVGKEDIEWWKTRFNLSGKYDLLQLNVDPKHEEDVYRALTWGALLIRNYGTKDIQHLSKILYDLQHCIDFDNKTDEELRAEIDQKKGDE